MIAASESNLISAYNNQSPKTSALYYAWTTEESNGWPVNYPGGGYCTCKVNKATTTGFGFAIAVMGNGDTFSGRWSNVDNKFLWRKLA